MEKRLFATWALSIFIFPILIFSIRSVYAFEQDLLIMRTPTDLKPLNLELIFQHRFYGSVDGQSRSTAGMDDGANVGLGFRFLAISTLEFNYMRLSYRKEIVGGASYAITIDPRLLRTQIDVQGFQYREIAGTYATGAFYLLSMDILPLIPRLKSVLNMGYDQDNERFGMAIGLSLCLVPGHVFLQSEYYPIIDNKKPKDQSVFSVESSTHLNPSYTTGLMLQTHGHHFKLFFGNSSEQSTRRLMIGSPVRQVFFGFVIQRLIPL